MNGSTNRIGVFVDVQNLFHWLREAFGDEVRLDYNALLKFAAERGEVVMANAYTARDGSNGRQERFLAALALMGFRVIVRPLKTLPNGAQKGNLDIEMAIDAVLAAHRLDEIILVTGDSDFAPVAERLAHKGKIVTVVGPNGATGVELVLACQHFFNANQVSGFVQTSRMEGLDLPKAA
jgi:uncharacterized LabA/DUF88 family protein